MPEADEEIRIAISIADEGARKKLSEFRENIELFKEAVRSTAKETDETLNVAFKKVKFESLDSLNNKLKSAREHLKNVKRDFADNLKAPQVKQAEEKVSSLVRAMTELRDVSSIAFTELKQEAKESAGSLDTLDKEAKETQGGIQGLISRFSNLGNVGQFVFGSILGLTAVTALQRVTSAFVDFAKGILQRGSEMTEVIFTLEVAIRGLQRIGLDTTIEGWTKRIQGLKKEFPFFPKREFIEGAALAALMTREFGFTEAQIADLVRQASILAQITGKDLLESVRGITFAIGSGYFESLQRAGVNISRAVVANEALAQGYEGVYNELEPTIRASVTYSVIQNNLNAIQDDASRKVETFAGQLQILTSRLIDIKNLFGEVVTSSDSFIESLEIINNLLEAVQDVYETLSRANIDIFAPFKEFTGINKIIEDIETLTVTLQGLANALEGVGVAARAAGQILGAFGTVASAFGLGFVSDQLNTLEEAFFNVSRSLEDLSETKEIEIPIRIGTAEFSQEEYEELLETIQDAHDEILEIEEDGLERRLDIQEDYWRDVQDGWEKHLDKLEDLQENFDRRIADIGTKEQQKVTDEITSNAFKVAEVAKKAAFRREEAERKFRDRELKSERRFQEKMRQLRENFLLNLEDAVRERDARQIIRLTRQFDLRRTQMVREEKLNKDDRTAQFQEELRQIEIQRQERLRQLAIEHERRLQAIAQQAERERAQAQIDFQRRQDAEKERFEREKIDRNERLAEQFEDLEQSIQDRINKVIDGIREEHNLSEKELTAIGDLWTAVYGPSGPIDVAIDYSLKRMAQLIGMMATLRAQRMAGMTFIPPGFTGEGVGFAGEQAEGGTIIAKKPTVAIFGEAGPEMATFTPLNRLGAQSDSRMTPMDVGMSKDGRIQLELLLSPDLEARITDNTLGELADINFAIERARK